MLRINDYDEDNLTYYNEDRNTKMVFPSTVHYPKCSKDRMKMKKKESRKRAVKGSVQRSNKELDNVVKKFSSRETLDDLEEELWEILKDFKAFNSTKSTTIDSKLRFHVKKVLEEKQMDHVTKHKELRSKMQKNILLRHETKSFVEKCNKILCVKADAEHVSKIVSLIAEAEPLTIRINNVFGFYKIDMNPKMDEEIDKKKVENCASHDNAESDSFFDIDDFTEESSLFPSES